MPLLDLEARYAITEDELLQASHAVMENQMFINGPEVQPLEETVAAYCDCKAAVMVTNDHER